MLRSALLPIALKKVGWFLLPLGLALANALHARPACEVSPVVTSPDLARQVSPWIHPEYPAGQCARRLPADNWVGNLVGNPLAVKLTGDFTGDGCGEDLLWHLPGLNHWILTKGLGGTEVIELQIDDLTPDNPKQFVGVYDIGLNGQEGVVWSDVKDGKRYVYHLDGSSELLSNTDIDRWFANNPQVERFSPQVLNIVAIGDSFTVGGYSDPIANFRERLWLQLFELTSCGREFAIDWVGTVSDYYGQAEPFFYASNFYLDKEHEGHSGYRACELRNCVEAWSAGLACTKVNDADASCPVSVGPQIAVPYTPDVALLMAGMNDLLRADRNVVSKRQNFVNMLGMGQLSDAVGETAAMIDVLRSGNPQILVVLSNLPGGGNPLGRSHWEGSGAEVYEAEREYLAAKNYRRYNHDLQQAAVNAVTSESPILFVDQYAHYVAEPAVHWDRIHPDYACHQLIADAYAGALDVYWRSDGQCKLPLLNGVGQNGNIYAVIGDFDMDGCAQDVAFRRYSGGQWSTRWWIRKAGSATPYALMPDAAGAEFVPGDSEQFLMTLDLDSDGLLDVVWRRNFSDTWQVNFGDPAKPSISSKDSGYGAPLVFDLASEELIVVGCSAWGRTQIVWTDSIESDQPVWQFFGSDGSVRKVRFPNDWRESAMFRSQGLRPDPPCQVIGSH